jgi:hypothetical protein
MRRGAGLLVLAVVFSLGLTTAPALQPALTTFGSDNFTIFSEPRSFNFSQSTDALTLNSPFSLGNFIGGEFGEPYYNWSLVPTFALVMRAVNGPIEGTLGVEFYDEVLNRIAVYVVATEVVGAASTTMELELSQSFSMDFTEVRAMAFNWSGGIPVPSGRQLVIEALVVPEPTTCSLLGLACLGWGAWRWRRMSARG